MNNNISNTYNPNFINSLLIWFITLCSLKFYTLLITITIAKVIALFGVLLVLCLLVIHIVYGNDSNIKKRFHIEISMIFMALIISAFAAEFFHDQPIASTLFAQYELYLFSFYFLLHKMKPEPDKLMKMFIWFGYTYVFIYLLQYLAYPVQLVASKVLEDRGTIRIGIPGSEFIFASWFILLSRYFETKEIKNIIGLLPFVLIMILLGSRQVLAIIALITILNILLSKTIKSKIFVFLVISLAIIPFYFLFKDIIDQIIAVSQKQQSSWEDDIRFMAAHYFLFDLNQNPIWILTGNGMPAPHSEFGKFILRLKGELGYYQSDVGIIGDFSKFGILFILAEIVFLIKLSLYSGREKYIFIRYIALSMLMSMFTGAGLGASLILFICFMFYIFEVDKQYTSNLRKYKKVQP